MRYKRYHLIMIIGGLILLLSIINYVAVLHRESVQSERAAKLHASAPPIKPPVQIKPSFKEVFSIHTNQKKVALTFDDGPDNRYTPQILDILKQYGVKATFFLVGRQVEKDPSVVERIHEEGHEIGNHTLTHPNLNKLTPEEARREIVDNGAKIKAVIGTTPDLFRTPYGTISNSIKEILKEQHLTLVNWSVDTLDWKATKAEQIVNNLKKEIQPGGIILQHSFGGKKVQNTIAALPQEIEWLQAQGYSLVTVTELMKLQDK
ncbi:peptidoglycan/xylan/chitin deacetylase (PgdA/CDA1 family) [Paenibacillus shirakamiensis]|uniref:Peptidoglycan/xylan/chitin deacetylase (PgdA/CDA1 family) n=1 Tax=Paenibacillus shirakamiensis TaxID=1265935 RepID=A0ABS4JF79_9BACL|nr:polysaccharide deacetylase family protein [Paenibacillus shirakamiensis]MBP2000370.1 peptidoglycan/xylan/chitin deacetylase (PgdA/CDA1 family) [Paenibacillus shirakamiensis]